MQNPTYSVTCPKCGTVHIVTNPAKAYCSMACRKSAAYQRRQLRDVQKVTEVRVTSRRVAWGLFDTIQDSRVNKKSP